MRTNRLSSAVIASAALLLLASCGGSSSTPPSTTPAPTPTFTPKLPHSGVTASQCYAAGSNALVSCTSASAIALNDQQDGMRTTVNAMSYSLVAKASGGNYDKTECVKDDLTGLVWEGKTASGTRAGSNGYTNYDSTTSAQYYNGSTYVNPTQAQIDAATNSVGYKNYVNSIALCGYTDWRLPTADELQSIVDYGIASDTEPAVNATWFPNTSANAHLTSNPVLGSASVAWNVNFLYGSVGVSDDRNYDGSVRMVRGAAWPTSRYTDSADGAEVTDNATGLIWRRCAEGQTWSGSTCTGTASGFTQEQALSHAKAQASATGKAWRVPNVKELASITKRTVSNPAIDTTAFPATPSGGFWSSSPVVSYARKAWSVYFDDGYLASYFIRSGNGFHVRLVR